MEPPQEANISNTVIVFFIWQFQQYITLLMITKSWYFWKQLSVHDYFTRLLTNIVNIKRFNLSRGLPTPKSFVFAAVKMFNSLHFNLIVMPDLKFKSEFKLILVKYSLFTVYAFYDVDWACSFLLRTLQDDIIFSVLRQLTPK